MDLEAVAPRLTETHLRYILGKRPQYLRLPRATKVGSNLGSLLMSATAARTLNVRFCELTAAGFEHLAHGLLVSPVLQHLDLFGNQIGDAGATALARCLRSPDVGLRTLVLAENRITAAGMLALASALASDTRVTAINLAGNALGPRGAQHVATMLRINRTLRHLDLECNALRSAGAAALAEALKANHTLETLVLTDNDVESNGAVSIGAALQHNTGLRTLALDDNDIDAPGAQAIATALKTNATLRSLRSIDKNGNDGRRGGGGGITKRC